MATLTASLAGALIPVRANLSNHHLFGSFGPGSALSLSGSSILLLAKVPTNAKVSVIFTGTSGATTQTLNLGVRSGADTSLTASALLAGGIGIAGGTSVTPRMSGVPYQCVRDDEKYERFKYVIASLAAGSPTASFQISYHIFYSVDAQT